MTKAWMPVLVFFGFFMAGEVAFSEVKGVGEGEKETVDVVYYAADGAVLARFDASRTDSVSGWDKEFAKKVETIRFFGEDGKPVVNEDGYAVETRVFEKLKNGGTSTVTSFFDVRDQPCMSPRAGFSSMRVDSAVGHAVVGFYDAEGKPCIPKVIFKVARMEVDWSEGSDFMAFDRYFGLVTKGNFEVRSFDAEGKPMLDQNGVARTVGRVESDGTQTTLYYGVKGEPKAFMNRFEKVVARYGKDGNVSEVQAQTMDGKLKDASFGPYLFSVMKADGDTVRLINAAGKEVKSFTADEFRRAWEEFLVEDDDTDYREKTGE